MTGLDLKSIPENTEGFGGEKPPRRVIFIKQCKKNRMGDRSLPKINYLCIVKYKQLTSEQRYTIFVLLQSGMKQKFIADSINVSISTISRELRRNSGRNGHYNWETAQANATYIKIRKPGNHRIKDSVISEVKEILTTEQWSPKQISGYLANKGIDISHETIYRIIRKDKKNGGDLYKNCRHRLKHRARPVGGGKRNIIPNRVSIAERPVEADGTRFGDWEMDTIVGKGNHGAIVTLVERSTGLLLMRKLNGGKRPKELAKTVIHLLSPFKEFVKTITTDNGTEFACHEMICRSLDTKVYFADPYSSWQKGAIENVNGLIRQYIPKSSEFSAISHQKVTRYMKKINSRPRERLNFKTPYECFYEKIS